ncbi:transposase [Trueperella pyogenes]|uniref:transposase n=1 Tax=Trueperella pyogenes TaxID=1661 RepID=UPI00345C6495
MAYTSGGVIAYQLCHKENKEAYRALLSRIPAPIMVVTDGNSGALAAIKECWTTTRIQRCLFHIQCNIRTITTIRPKTQQHKALYHLGLDLTKITTTDKAIAWQKKLAIFHELYDTWPEEKPTVTRSDPTRSPPSRARTRNGGTPTNPHAPKYVP